MKSITDKDKIDEIFTRGVGEFVDPEGKFRKKLETNPEKVVIKFGVDPTRPDLHLGHAVILRKLRQLQDLGCKIVFLIGDYTAQIGDPTGKDKTRLEIEQKEIDNNMKTYLEQVDKVLSTQKDVFSWIRNSDWFTSVTDIQPSPGLKINFSRGNKMFGVFDANSFIGKALLFEKTRMQETHLKNSVVHSVSLSFVLNTLRKISHNRLIDRNMFKERLGNNEELFMHEMLYPVLQGIDSIILARIYNSCDLEVGGNAQHFNMIMGRQVMSIHKQEPQAVLSFKLLEGTDGKEKMSKSSDNYIGITDEPNDMYGKVMSIPDSSIGNYFELCTFTPMGEVEEIRKKIKQGSVNPKDTKMNLAKQIVEIYHGKDKAVKAEENFVQTFQKGEIPEEMTEIVSAKNENLMELVVKKEIVSSRADFRRLVEEGAVHNMDTGEQISDTTFTPRPGQKFKIGKRRFIRIK